jgi:hypothetical protein
MSVKIKWSESGVLATIDKTFANGREMLCTQILRDCNRYCKEDTGMLIMSSLIHSRLKDGILIWNTPYAARQYYAIPTANKEPNHDASWHWVDVAKKLHAKDWAKSAQNIVTYYGKKV